MAKKIYIVYNQWQADCETWSVYMEKAFSSENAANEYKEKLEKESNDGDNNFIVEEVDFE